MTAKEKALELVVDFYSVNAESVENGMEWQMAKRCALIAVDEIINLCASGLSETKYWQEVKQEIENL